MHRSALGHITRPEPVDLDGFGARNPVSPDDRFVGLARHDPAAADHDGRDGNHLVDPRVEPGCLAIQNQHLIRRSGHGRAKRECRG